MEIITVHTSQNIDIDYEVGGIGERIVAYLVDLGIFVALLIIGAILSAKVFSREASSIYFIVIGIAFLVYDLIFESFFNGQSPGKLVMKIRVISLDGSRPRFSQFLLRWLFRIVDNWGITFFLGALVSIIVTDKGQRIGDVLAGTVVVRTRPRTTASNIIFTRVDDSYVPVFPEVLALKEEDIALIHEVIEAYVKTGNTLAVYKTADKIRDLLKISLPPNMNSLAFLQTIIKDYSHIIAHADIL